jgi:predicted DCC family thiol-disulfide oxidoreductase YuxK
VERAAASKPEAPILVFDGDCGFCTWSADWIRRRLPAGAVVAPWQLLDLAAHGLTEADVTTAAYWIDADGRHRGADGIARALEAAGRGWRMVGRLAGRPPLVWLARGMYTVVARNRHRLPGSTPACKLPPPA